MSLLTVESLAQVRAETVRWLWRPFLPRGKLTLLDGDPGVGKSLLTIDLAARLSRGGVLPDGSPADRPHTVLLLNAEDSAADTTRPRAAAAGADLDRLGVVSAADRLPHLPDCLPDLERLIAMAGADLLVIDPLMAFLPPKVSAGIDQCVRTALTPLARLAERTDCGILLVRHLRKQAGGKAVRRGQGSMGIAGAARTGLLAGPHPADPTLGVLAVVKSNLAGAVPSLGYRIAVGPTGLPVVEWVGPAELSADGIGGKPPERLHPREWAGLWLQQQLANGPKRATEVLTAATAAGIPEKTLRRAKEVVRVESHQVKGADGRREWYWYDPDAPWPADAPFKKPRRFELPPLLDLPPIGE
jgi:hypothetical protein